MGCSQLRVIAFVLMLMIIGGHRVSHKERGYMESKPIINAILFEGI